MKKFIEIIKKKWLINGTKTFILIAILVAIFIGIHMLMEKLELSPIDLSQDKLYTLTEESKAKARNIDKDINIYFIGYSDESTQLDLARQYHKENEKINVEAIDLTERPDIANKYGIESGTVGIVVECGDNSKILTESDLYTYDMTTYETIDITEQRLTTAITSVSTDEIPKVYFLDGYSDFGLNVNMNFLNVYLGNEIMEVSTLDILTQGKVPDDCDTLVIMTPNKDFDEIAANAIIDYINSGRNILWLNAAITSQIDMPNVQRVLEIYGVNPFEVGIIRETDTNKMMSGSQDIVKPDIQYTEITKDIYNTTGLFFINATRINLVDDEKLEELNVAKTEILNTSENSYFRSEFTKTDTQATGTDEEGPLLVGVELVKTISEANEETGEEEKKSTLIIYGENYFASDYMVTSNSQVAALQLAYNKDLVLNSMAYLTEREEDITARKNTGTVTYTATDTEDTVIKAIIFTVPVVIVIIGIVVWQARRRKGAKVK